MIDIMIDSRLPPPGSKPSAKEFFRLGLGYASGHEFQKDIVLAHALFDLAARLGSLEAQVYRKELDAEMEPVDIAEAQSLAREWLKASGAPQSQSLRWRRPMAAFTSV